MGIDTVLVTTKFDQLVSGKYDGGDRLGVRLIIVTGTHIQCSKHLEIKLEEELENEE